MVNFSTLIVAFVANLSTYNFKFMKLLKIYIVFMFLQEYSFREFWIEVYLLIQKCHISKLINQLLKEIMILNPLLFNPLNLYQV